MRFACACAAFFSATLSNVTGEVREDWLSVVVLGRPVMLQKYGAASKLFRKYFLHTFDMCRKYVYLYHASSESLTRQLAARPRTRLAPASHGATAPLDSLDCCACAGIASGPCHFSVMLTSEEAIVGLRVKVPKQKTVGSPFDAKGSGLVNSATHYGWPVIIKQVVPWPVEGKQCVMLGIQGRDSHDGGYYALEDLFKF